MGTPRAVRDAVSPTSMAKCGARRNPGAAQPLTVTPRPHALGPARRRHRAPVPLSRNDPLIAFRLTPLRPARRHQEMCDSLMGAPILHPRNHVRRFPRDGPIPLEHPGPTAGYGPGRHFLRPRFISSGVAGPRAVGGDNRLGAAGQCIPVQARATSAGRFTGHWRSCGWAHALDRSCFDRRVVAHVARPCFGLPPVSRHEGQNQSDPQSLRSAATRVHSRVLVVDRHGRYLRQVRPCSGLTTVGRLAQACDGGPG